MAKGKPQVSAKEGVKDMENREDAARRDKRPKPIGPANKELDKALAEGGAIEPDPDTPSRTPRR